MTQLWFYKGKERFFGKLIRWYTKSLYSHVEIVVNGRAYGADAWSGVVRCRPVSTFNPTHWDVVSVTPTLSSSWLDQQIGKPYDYLGILGFFANGVHDKKAWYCSELAAVYVGITQSPISPQDLFKQTESSYERDM